MARTYCIRYCSAESALGQVAGGRGRRTAAPHVRESAKRDENLLRAHILGLAMLYLLCYHWDCHRPGLRLFAARQRGPSFPWRAWGGASL